MGSGSENEPEACCTTTSVWFVAEPELALAPLTMWLLPKEKSPALRAAGWRSARGGKGWA